MQIAIYISTVTGNTRRIAMQAAEALESIGCSVECIDSISAAKPADADLHIIAFWCRRQAMDPVSLRIARMLQDLPTIAVGTMGSYPDSEYGLGVLRNAKAFVRRAFVCQGKIDSARTEARRALSPDHPHYLNDEGYRRHLDSRTHPDTADLAAVSEFVLSCINEYNNGKL